MYGTPKKKFLADTEYFYKREEKMVTFEQIKNDKAIKTYITKADESLSALGYTEHSFAHVMKVADTASELLSALGYSEREVELTKIAGYMHDIGNLVNRVDHSLSGALMSFRLLDHMGMEAEEIAAIVTAIGNHDEGTGVPVSPMAAAIILADKSDVRRSRVRNTDEMKFDIHDRVNYSVIGSKLHLDTEKKEVRLTLKIDTAVGSLMDYFEIFLGRMTLCRKAAEKLGLVFKLTINEQNFI